MRITRDSLMAMARDYAALRFQQGRDLICIYLTGSMRLSSPLLGGSTDIDLVFVHINDPAEGREIVPINDDVSYDITHLGQSAFDQPRRLRMDPWLGSYLCEDPVLLRETRHWFEFTQAAVCAHFTAPETVLARLKPLADSARQVWFSLQKGAVPPGAESVFAYLNAVEAAVNACACLYGPPLTERRFFLDFTDLAERENFPALALEAKSLVCGQPLPEGFWEEFLPAWRNALAGLHASPSCPAELSPARLNYYYKATDTLRAEHPASALWIMLRTWCMAQQTNPDPAAWENLLSQAGFTAEGVSEKLEALDHFLDICDEIFENWARFHGL